MPALSIDIIILLYNNVKLASAGSYFSWGSSMTRPTEQGRIFFLKVSLRFFINSQTIDCYRVL